MNSLNSSRRFIHRLKIRRLKIHRLKPAAATGNRLKPCYATAPNLLEQVSHNRRGIDSMRYSMPIHSMHDDDPLGLTHRLKPAADIGNRLKPCCATVPNLLEQVSHSRRGIDSMRYSMPIHFMHDDDPPLVILDELAQLETEIQTGMAELRGMLA